MNCPQCPEEILITKKYENIEIDTCKKCFGVWLDYGEIEQIINNHSTKFSDDEINKTLSLSFSGLPQGEKSLKRNCPKCFKEMNVVNYTGDSGIIIDTCPQNHGIWLDKHELEKIQIYREYWINKASEHEKSLSDLLKSKDKKSKDSLLSKSLLYSLACKLGEKIF